MYNQKTRPADCQRDCGQDQPPRAAGAGGRPVWAVRAARPGAAAAAAGVSPDQAALLAGAGRQTWDGRGATIYQTTIVFIPMVGYHV